MKDEEITIRKMHNLKRISFLDLLPGSNKSIIGLLVEFETDKNYLLDYCTSDELFGVFLETIIKTYNIEKEYNDIQVDDMSKLIIENEFNIKEDNTLITSDTKEIVYGNDEIKHYEGIILYFLNFVLKIKGTDEVLKSINGNYRLYNVDGKYPLKFDRGNIIFRYNMDLIKMEIEYLSNGINVHIKDNDKDYFINYIIRDESVVSVIDVHMDNTCIYYDTNIFNKESVEFSDYKDIIGSNYNTYKMPWGNMILNKNEKVNTDKEYYIETDDTVHVLNNGIKTFNTSYFNGNNLTVKTNEVITSSDIYKCSDGVLFQTYYEPCNLSNFNIKDNYEGKYVYKMLGNKIDDIKKYRNIRRGN